MSSCNIFMEPKILIVGAGISGLTAALHLAEQGVSVALFTLTSPYCSDATGLSEGLFPSASPSLDGPSTESHFARTIIAGEFLANQELPKLMCQRTHETLERLNRWGFVAETGQQLLQVLVARLLGYESDGLVSLFEGWEFISLARKENGSVAGIICMHHPSLEIKAFECKAVIFCTGGIGALFGRSTQSVLSQGSAAAILYQQGAIYANAEFVQCFPAAFVGRDRSYPIPTALLHGGARFWVSRRGRPWYFLEDFYPQLEGRVPYVVACRAIHKVLYEMELGMEGSPCVNLDFSKEALQVLSGMNGGLVNLIRRLGGLDPAKQPLPVQPAVSYSMGGLWVDSRHMTNIPGVFAAGECQYQYHGANVLEGNTILSSLFGGMKAAEEVYGFIEGHEDGYPSPSGLFEREITAQQEKNREIMDQSGRENAYRLHDELGQWMSKNATLVRHNDELKKTDEKIREWMQLFDRISLTDKGRWMNAELLFTRRLWNMLELSLVIIHSSLLRNESRGFHYKPEFPLRNDKKYLKTSKASWSQAGPKIEYEDINLTYLKPVVAHE